MRIIEDIVSQGHGKCDPSYLFVHSTANPGATAKNHRDLYANPSWKYAVQYVCDWTGDVYHCVPDDRLCYAVGNGNRYGVSLEICEGTNEGEFKGSWDTAVDFCAHYLAKRGWGIDRILSHDDCRKRWGGTDHTDPIPYFKRYGRTWEQFVAAVAARMGVQGSEGDDMGMQCIYQPNGENRMVYYDGTRNHPLEHPDEVTVIQDVYKRCTGRDIPVFELGTQNAPWAARFMEATER